MDREPPPSRHVCLTEKSPALKMPSSSQYFCFVPKYLPVSAAPPDRCRHGHTQTPGSVYSCDGHLRVAWSPHLLPQHHQLLGSVLNPDFWGYNLHTGKGSPINCTVLGFPKYSGLCGHHCLKDWKTKGFYHSTSLPRAPLWSAPSSTLSLCSFPTVWLFPKSCIHGIVQCAGFESGCFHSTSWCASPVVSYPL